MQFNITTIIIIITVLVSIGGFSNQKILNDLIFYPPAVTRHRQWYRFFSCGLIHADWGHLFFNMLSLYFFGGAVEEAFTLLFPQSGKAIYLAMYISALLVSLLPTYFKHKNDEYYRSLGASGAVSAVVFAGLAVAPDSDIYVYFIKMPGFVFAPLYLVLSIVLERKAKDNVNHSAHIWGSLYGLAFILISAYIAGFDLVSYFIDSVSGYIRAKGWIK
jgi:membrane associated rhomboid family serine protease